MTNKAKELGIPWRKDHRGYIVDDEGSHLGEITCHDGFAIHAANQHHDLVEALEKLACLGNGDYWGNSEGNVIAQKALGLNPRDIYGQRAHHAPQEAGRDDNGPDSHPTPINDNEASGTPLRGR